MKILAFFSSSGTPATGLTPTIRIRELAGNTLVVTDAAMTEVGDGHYQYNFTTYDKDIDYAIRCDGGVSLSGGDRYTYAGNENYIDDISESITENTSAGSSYTNDLIVDLNLDVLAASASSKQDFLDLNTKIDSLSASVPSLLEIVNGVWDEPISAHTTYDTYGAVLKKLQIRRAQITSVVNTTRFATSLTETTTDYWRNAMILMLSGPNEGQMRVIKAYNGVNKQITLETGLIKTPQVGSQFIIYPQRRFQVSDVNLEEIGDWVWKHPVSAGTPGTAEDYLVTTNTKIDSLSASNQTNFDTVNTNIAAASGGDITSISTQITSLSASNQANFDTVNNNIANVNTNILAVSADIVDISLDLKRLLGLTHENIFIDNPTYDGDGNLTSARVRIYSNPASVGTASDVIGTYTISAPSSAPGQFITWSQVRV